MQTGLLVADALFYEHEVGDRVAITALTAPFLDEDPAIEKQVGFRHINRGKRVGMGWD